MINVIFCILFMCYAIGMFWDSSPALKFCSSMKDAEIAFLDMPYVLSNDSENFVAQRVLDDESIPITIDSILRWDTKILEL